VSYGGIMWELVLMIAALVAVGLTIALAWADN
jgi:hypothetical protein